jgi:hypothetical protein
LKEVNILKNNIEKINYSNNEEHKFYFMDYDSLLKEVFNKIDEIIDTLNRINNQINPAHHDVDDFYKE